MGEVGNMSVEEGKLLKSGEVGSLWDCVVRVGWISPCETCRTNHRDSHDSGGYFGSGLARGVSPFPRDSPPGLGAGCCRSIRGNRHLPEHREQNKGGDSMTMPVLCYGVRMGQRRTILIPVIVAEGSILYHT